MKTRILSFFKNGHERTVAAKKNIAGLFLLKIISIALSFVLVPLTIGFVSSLQYGIWITLSSIIAWLSFFDIGLGNGFRNRFVEAIAIGDKKRAQVYVSTIYASISIIIIISWCVLTGVIKYSDWSKILNAPSMLADDLKIVVFIAVTSFCFQFILGLIKTLLTALQKPMLSALFDTVSQAIIVLIIFLLAHQRSSGSLLILSVVTGGVYVFVLIAGSLWLFTHELKDYSPSLKKIDFNSIKDLTGLGLKFFFLQIFSLLFYSTNNIIIAQICGPEDVTVYNIAYKYMFILQMGFSIMITPFWSAFTDAYVKEDYFWMKQVERKLRNLVFLTALFGSILLVVSPQVYAIWIKDTVSVPFILTALIYVYQILNIWCSTYSSMLYGIGKIKVQMISSAVVCILNVPLTIIGCYYWGMSGLVIMQIILILMNVWVGPYQLNKLLNKSAHGIWNR